MAKHIRQVVGDIPAAQVQLMHHQHTQLPTRNFPRRKSNSTSGQKPQNCKTPDVPMIWKIPDTPRPELIPKSATGAVTHHMQKAFNVKLESSSVNYAINLATSHQYASKKAEANTPLIPFMQGNRKHNNYVRGHFTPSKMQGAVNMIQTQKRNSAYK